MLDGPEYSDQATGVYRPVIDDGKDEQAFFGHTCLMTGDVMSTSAHGHGRDQVSSQQVLQFQSHNKVMLSFNFEALCKMCT